jgi:hypothetical protein
VLAFLGAIGGARLADEVICRRRPAPGTASSDTEEWWVEVDVRPALAAPLVHTAGGQAYAGGRRGFVAVSAAGKVDRADVRRDEVPERNTWPEVELPALLAAGALIPSPLPAIERALAFVPGDLCRLVLRRALGLGVQVQLATARCSPLLGEGAEQSLIRFAFSAPGKQIPRALLRTIAALPYTIVCRSGALDGERLLVDVRYRTPLAESLLAEMLPPDATWILGGPDVGNWTVLEVGHEIEGSHFVEAPELPSLTPTPVAASVLPRPLPIRLVPSRAVTNRIDAVVLDDLELEMLPKLLMARPLSESAHLALGPGAHLLVAAGGLVTDLPLGVPVSQVGPGGLYVQLGRRFDPPMPSDARGERFGVGPDQHTAVALLDSGAYRFDLANLLPCWALWVGEAPSIERNLPLEAQLRLNRVAARVRRAEPKLPEHATVRGAASGSPVNLRRLRQEAVRAEARGDLAHAAELYEAASDFASAASMYRRAAEQASD